MVRFDGTRTIRRITIRRITIRRITIRRMFNSSHASLSLLVD